MIINFKKFIRVKAIEIAKQNILGVVCIIIITIPEPVLYCTMCVVSGIYVMFSLFFPPNLSFSLECCYLNQTYLKE